MAKTTVEVTALKPFALGASEHLPGRAKVPASAVAKLVEKGLIEAPEQPAGDADGSLDALQVESDVLRELTTRLAPLQEGDEGIVGALNRLLQEHSDAKDGLQESTETIDTLRTQNRTLKGQVTKLQKELGKPTSYPDEDIDGTAPPETAEKPDS